MMIEDPFFFRVYGALPREITESTFSAGKSIELLGVELTTWRFEGTLPALTIGFEELLETMVKWSGVYFEWDGSFGWVGKYEPSSPRKRWKMDGMVYDRDQAIQYIEVKGICDLTSWRQWIELLRGTAESSMTDLWIHLVAKDVLLTSSDFERLVEAQQRIAMA